MRYKNLRLLGTSHIARQSVEAVKKHIEEEQPDIVALELDPNRLKALVHKGKTKLRVRDIRRIGVKGYLFGLLGAWAERKLGEVVKVKPGTEMLTAVHLAKKHRILLALIDQPIEITLRRLSQTLTWKEKFRFIADIVKAAVTRKPEIEFDLTKVPTKKVIDKLIKKVKIRYPNVYKVLIQERNHVMARNLAGLMIQHPYQEILAIIGAGHEEDMLVLIKKYLKLPKQ